MESVSYGGHSRHGIISIPFTKSFVLGRFYSKFSQKRVIDLNSVGLYHLISLFLTLANTTDTSEVVGISIVL